MSEEVHKMTSEQEKTAIRTIRDRLVELADEAENAEDPDILLTLPEQIRDCAISLQHILESKDLERWQR